MNTEPLVWVVNDYTEDFEKIDLDLKKKIILKSKRPIQLPKSIAMKYIKFNTIKIIDNPEKYFSEDNLMKRLIIRDAGIGDLILLEPVISQLKKNNIELSILSRFPEVFENNPIIDCNIKMERKDDINVDLSDYDYYDDLRSYSETCENRDKKHRTDCYNQIFNFEIKEKEPKLYFRKEEKSLLQKEENKIYIGFAPDGSHCYRRFSNQKAIEIIEYLLNQNENYIIVLFGNRKLVNYKHKRLIDLQEKTKIRETINLIKDLDFMISVDSGLMHVALSLHIPTIAIFSIIQPELRIKYYTGQKEVIVKTDCNGCGSWHMQRCRFGDADKDINFLAPCLNVSGQEIHEQLNKMHMESNKRIFYNEAQKKEIISNNSSKDVFIYNIRKSIGKKLTMPIIVLNEEKNLPRFIELVMSHKAIGKVIAIDGGSNDKTVDYLQKAGAFVYVNHYDKNYHDMQALQRNISFSFVKDNEPTIFMDIDECFSKGLSDYLFELAENCPDYALVPRKTFNYFNDINDETKRIKDWPDYQPRIYKWNRKYKFVGSPHHQTLNCPNPIKLGLDKYIIHFEKENKDRKALESQWAKMHEETKKVYV